MGVPTFVSNSVRWQFKPTIEHLPSDTVALFHCKNVNVLPKIIVSGCPQMSFFFPSGSSAALYSLHTLCYRTQLCSVHFIVNVFLPALLSLSTAWHESRKASVPRFIWVPLSKQLLQLSTHKHTIHKSQVQASPTQRPNRPTVAYKPPHDSSLVSSPYLLLPLFLLLTGLLDVSQEHKKFFPASVPLCCLFPLHGMFFPVVLETNSYISFRSQLKCHPYHWC